MSRSLVRVFSRGNRKESPQDCAARALRFLEPLSRLDPVFASFATTRRIRRKYTDIPVPLELNALAEMFARGVNRRDSDRSVIHELGFALYAQTPGKNHASLSMHCGVHTWTNHNSCILELPSGEPEAGRLVNVPTFTEIMRLMVEAFEPDVGDAGFYEYWSAVTPEERQAKEHTIDWMTYFSREWGTVPPLPAPVRIEPVSDRGMLVILTPEPISASNPEHVALGRRVRELLNRAGLLERRKD